MNGMGWNEKETFHISDENPFIKRRDQVGDLKPVVDVIITQKRETFQNWDGFALSTHNYELRYWLAAGVFTRLLCTSERRHRADKAIFHSNEQTPPPNASHDGSPERIPWLLRRWTLEPQVRLSIGSSLHKTSLTQNKHIGVKQIAQQAKSTIRDTPFVS